MDIGKILENASAEQIVNMAGDYLPGEAADYAKKAAPILKVGMKGGKNAIDVANEYAQKNNVSPDQLKSKIDELEKKVPASIKLALLAAGTSPKEVANALKSLVKDKVQPVIGVTSGKPQRIKRF